MPRLKQASLAGGEISPAVGARVDIDKYKSSLGHAENVFIRVHGGASNRPGTKFVGEVKDSSASTRIIPFEYNTEQTYILEFGNLYMRVHKDGEQVLDTSSSHTISGATQADPCVITATGHTLLDGEEVYISGVVGMTELNGRNFKVANKTANTFEITDLGDTDIDSTGYTAYSSAGDADKIYELTTTYATTDLFDLKFVQSADVMTINNTGYIGRELTRTDHDAWTITDITIAAEQASPTSPSVSPNTSGSTSYSYKITAVAETTAEESSPATATTSTGAATPDNDVSWTGASGAEFYNVYREVNGLHGFIGRTEDTSFTDEDVTPDLDDTPPRARDPISASGDYPGVPGYFKQRRIFAQSTNDPQRIWMTQTANHYNLDISSPAKDDDAIIVTLAALKVNEIRHFVPLGDLIVLTSGGEWKISGIDGVITPAGIQAEQQTYYGSTDLPPILAGDVAVYMQPGQSVRDLAYQFNVDAYGGNDISILARHLFDDYTIVDWDYAPAPHSFIWCVRDDGVINSLTYVREQEVYGWSHHTTKGLFKSVASVREGDEDIMYTIVERTIGSRTVKYIERLQEHAITDVQDGFYVDAGLSLDSPFTITGFTNADPCVITTSSAHGFSNGDTVDITGIKVVDTDETLGYSADTEIEGTGYTVANVTSTTFELQNESTDVDSTNFSVYHSDGEVRKALTTISGLWHLEGETVIALANGYVVRNLTVSDGAITLSTAASRVHVGLPYTAEVETLRLDPGQLNQSVGGKFKKLSKLSVTLEKTMGLWVGPDRDHMREAKFGLPTLWGQPQPFVTGLKSITLSPSWNKDGQVVIQQRDPLPMTVLAITPEVAVGGN